MKSLFISLPSPQLGSSKLGSILGLHKLSVIKFLFSTIITLVLLLFLSSCGQQYNARTKVKHFMKENLIDNSQLSNVKYSKIDSTKLLTPTRIEAMRSEAANATIYKKDIAYPKSSGHKKLFTLRVSYNVDGQQHISTFYLSGDLKEVVAFKTD